MVTCYHFFVVIFEYTQSYMHVASPGMVRKPCPYPGCSVFDLLGYCYKLHLPCHYQKFQSS